MIIFNSKGFHIRKDHPDSDWTGQAKYIVPDGSELANKIISLYPWYDFVVEDGELVDVVEVEHDDPEPVEPEPTELEILNSKVEYLAMMMEVDLDE